jgi:hypothetical protein
VGVVEADVFVRRGAAGEICALAGAEEAGEADPSS